MSDEAPDFDEGIDDDDFEDEVAAPGNRIDEGDVVDEVGADGNRILGARAKAAMARSISPASRTLTGLTSIPIDGATDWMAAN